ncbi:hemolysin D [Acidithiobacillus marinus]|uniref:Hemolysin D n=1 Tax=Acidithiobacillus marinus TaxID=187490 RepID=A0A2I1DJU4_9PROT|nr:efflux RND transporter periplasmic adaptor subunit [Acidithiobacillus marinus]PKY10134.1 hemolysin D [Acidithiobacillus marinus]
MNKRRILVILIIVLIAAGIAAYFFLRPQQQSNTLTLYGNVDIRTVHLAFDASGRIARLLVQEGDAVQKGQLLGELDRQRFLDTVRRDQALVDAQQQVVNKLHAGTRPEEIAEARAALAAATATLHNAHLVWQRQQKLGAEQYVPKQRVDDAQAALSRAEAQQNQARQALQLALQGPRKEDIAAAESTLAADRAALALAQRNLADSRLVAPDAGVIQDRILEAGDMASPQSPVFTLALENPVWVRAYLPEPELGKVREGMRAEIYSDSFPDKAFRGWVGFISLTAEFSPKTVQTTELRTQLVYRLRVYACNPEHRLRLGMPVTVKIPLRNNRPKASNTQPCQG